MGAWYPLHFELQSVVEEKNKKWLSAKLNATHETLLLDSVESIASDKLR